MSAPATTSIPTPIERYYQLHSRVYDATRWSFLFGRAAILDDIAAAGNPGRILEVGCGTGKNLVALAHRFPLASITGVDLSETMLDVARRKIGHFGGRVKLVHRAYDHPLSNAQAQHFDLVLFSYALSMFNPGYEVAIAAACDDLACGGHVAAVDFHDTPLPVFAQWMGLNHVRMEGQLLPPLHQRLTTVSQSLNPAYGGVWRYLRYVGRKA